MTVDELRNMKPEFLQRAKHNGYVCPICGNGTGKDGDGITTKDGQHYKCFKCGFYGDVIDLVGVHFGIEEDKAKFAKAYEVFGATPEPMNKTRRNNTRRPDTKQRTQEDYTAFYEEAERNNDYKYLQGRGISEQVQKRFHVGFVPNWKSPQAIKTTLERGGNPANLSTSPRCIIPRSKFNYLARDTRTELTDEQKKYAKQNAGATDLFNIKALQESQTIFIVEGEIDAMSIYEAGGVAIATCSTANIAKFIDTLKREYKGQAFILCLDNDEAGHKAQEQLAGELTGLEIPFVIANYTAHDCNEYLQQDKEAFVSMVHSMEYEAGRVLEQQQGNEYKAGALLDYFKTIEEQPAGFEAKTGFEELDRLLFGGLHEGLYIIGAISSLGKTTFSLQVADQIAESGQDVLFFSLEMSKYELVAKSLSRWTYKLYRECTTADGHNIARDTAQILNNRRYKSYTQEEKQAIKEAINNYAVSGEHLYIYEGRYKGERLTVQHIRTITKNHIQTTGRKPVVFIDYLQIIAPADVRATDKQNTDTAVFELKELSRDYNIPVFAISSFNRENYEEPVTMKSFKESGAVEYSSDILLGLQYSGMEYQEGDTDKKRKERLRELFNSIHRAKRNKEPIEIDLKCLKNRNGYQFTTSFYMNPAYNFFEQILGQAQFVRDMKTAGLNGLKKG